MSLETMPDEAFDVWAVQFDRFLFKSLNAPLRFFFLDTGHFVLCFFLHLHSSWACTGRQLWYGTD